MVLGRWRRPFILIGGTLAALMVFLLPRIDQVDRFLGGKQHPRRGGRDRAGA
ncbi:hypothetical protein LP420_27935 [Massilia sp. B-10]|nr:hypothetical protein LP420_27935 [Massilia sp. B-10]